MAVLQVVKEFDSGDMILGYVCQYPSGEYWFNPRMPHRRSSRKGYDKPYDCIPRWVRKEADRIEKAA